MVTMIKIACQRGGSEPYSEEVEGETFGSWAAHDALNGWGFKVTFLRFGLAIPFDFQSMESACRAAEEINALKENWDGVTHAGVRSLKTRIVEIAERNGGERTLGGLTVKGEPPPVESLPA